MWRQGHGPQLWRGLRQEQTTILNRIFKNIFLNRFFVFQFIKSQNISLKNNGSYCLSGIGISSQLNNHTELLKSKHRKTLFGLNLLNSSVTSNKSLATVFVLSVYIVVSLYAVKYAPLRPNLLVT